MKKKLSNFLLVQLISFISILAQGTTNVCFNSEQPQIKFAAEEIKQALERAEINYKLIVPLSNLNDNESNIVFLNIIDKKQSKLIKNISIDKIDKLKPEGFIIHCDKKQNNTVWIIGIDNAGLMYGGLEVAEVINVRGLDAIESQFQNPYMKVRGTKFNIPLDVRTPTYTDPCDAAQKNIPEMWNFDFWKEYIDDLARNRYNTISLWNMHPFPSMVKVPDYPDIALDDVRRSRVNWQENYLLQGYGFDAPEIVNNFEVIKTISIEEKIEFWKKVMAYGKERNVQFFILTWNIFVYGTEGKYGITDDLNNSVTTDYFRKSIKQMVLTYPDLAGIGLTTGENMYAYSSREKEEWAFATYGRGVLDALKEQPDRKINLIHRQHETNANEISRIFNDVKENRNINFIFSFKYAKAHVYSSVDQGYHEDFVKDISKENYKTLWTLRNDDVFMLRWGAPDFVRDFIKNIPYNVSEGYYYGSDQYVWGREFMSKNSENPRPLDVRKHWYQFMCWGRLGYNPDMSNDRFIDYLNYRFPEIDGRDMFNAWQNASMVYPWVTGFHWGALDFQWYIESGQSRHWVSKTPSGFHDVNHFINLKPHPGTDNISIPDYVKAYLEGQEINGESPINVADKIIKSTDQALQWADQLQKNYVGELGLTIDDIRIISWMGKYYAHKILGSTYLHMFRESLNKEWFNKAMVELNLSAGYWRHYAAGFLANNKNVLWTNRVGYVDWKKNFLYALYDVTSNGGYLDLLSMEATPGGTILEAEEADFTISKADDEVKGFTGDGYVALGVKIGLDNQKISWKYQASEEKKYVLEFRYTLNSESVLPPTLNINGNVIEGLEFWDTGHRGNWVWTRVIVDLKEGENLISLEPQEYLLIDHLNILK